MKSFNATQHATVNIVVAATTANTAVTIRAAAGPMQVRVMNNGTATAWIAFGDNTVTASSTKDIPVPSGGAEVFTVNVPDGGSLYAAAIAAAATGPVFFTPGVGI